MKENNMMEQASAKQNGERHVMSLKTIRMGHRSSEKARKYI